MKNHSLPEKPMQYVEPFPLTRVRDAIQTERHGFSTLKLHVSVSESGRQYKMLKPFSYSCHGFTVYVVKGFVTDFASTPRFFWRILPPWDKHMRAAVVHDWIYRTPYIDISRKAADVMFLHAMEELGVGSIKRNVMYRAVRLFGGKSYKQRDLDNGD